MTRDGVAHARTNHQSHAWVFKNKSVLCGRGRGLRMLPGLAQRLPRTRRPAPRVRPPHPTPPCTGCLFQTPTPRVPADARATEPPFAAVGRPDHTSSWFGTERVVTGGTGGTGGTGYVRARHRYCGVMIARKDLKALSRGISATIASGLLPMCHFALLARHHFVNAFVVWKPRAHALSARVFCLHTRVKPAPRLSAFLSVAPAFELPPGPRAPSPPMVERGLATKRGHAHALKPACLLACCCVHVVWAFRVAGARGDVGRGRAVLLG